MNEVFAFSLFWLAAAADVYTTKRCLIDHDDLELRERMPVARFFLKWGLAGLIIHKLLCFAPLALLATTGSGGYAAALAFGIAALLFWVAYRNRRLYRQRHGRTA